MVFSRFSHLYRNPNDDVFDVKIPKQFQTNPSFGVDEEIPSHSGSLPEEEWERWSSKERYMLGSQGAKG